MCACFSRKAENLMFIDRMSDPEYLCTYILLSNSIRVAEKSSLDCNLESTPLRINASHRAHFKYYIFSGSFFSKWPYAIRTFTNMT